MMTSGAMGLATALLAKANLATDFLATAVLATAVAIVPGEAAAQAPAKPPAPAEPDPVLRHFVITEAELGGKLVPVDGVLVYERVGTKPPQLRLDVCVPRSRMSSAVDRAVVPLAIARNTMSGSAPSEVKGVPTKVALKTEVVDARPMLSGTIEYGAASIALRQIALEYEPGLGPSEGGSAYLSTVGLLANEVVASISPDALRAVLDALRTRRAVLAGNQLTPGCSDLRAGRQNLLATVAPEEVKALAAALKAIPGVEDVNVAQYKLREDGVKLPASTHSSSIDTLVERFAAVAGRVLGAGEPARRKPGPRGGERLVVVTRETENSRPLGLAEVVTVTVLVGPAGPEKPERMLFITNVGSRYVDRSPNPLEIAQELGDTAVYTDLQPGQVSAALAQTFARETGGEADLGSGRR